MTSDTTKRLDNLPEKPRRSVGQWLGAIAFGAVVTAGATAAVLGLHARAALNTFDDAQDPIAVATLPLARVDHYLLRESFAGRIEAARETDMAFERAGLVTRVMVEEGERVTTGQTLAELDTEPLEIERQRLMAERSALEADIGLAERTTKRREDLQNQGWETSQSYDEARFSLAASQAQRDAIDAALAAIELDIEKSTISAPFAGTVAERAIDEGAVVSAGTALLRLQETGKPQVRIGVPPNRAAELAVGQVIEVTYQGRTVAGKIAAIAPDLQLDTRTVSILADLDPGVGVTVGQIARLTLPRRIAQSGMWVPLAALQEGERGLWSVHTVDTVDGGSVIAREAVEILHIDGERAFVRGSLQDGALLVSAGPHRLTVGQHVVTTGTGGD